MYFCVARSSSHPEPRILYVLSSQVQNLALDEPGSGQCTRSYATLRSPDELSGSGSIPSTVFWGFLLREEVVSFVLF